MGLPCAWLSGAGRNGGGRREELQERPSKEVRSLSTAILTGLHSHSPSASNRVTDEFDHPPPPLPPPLHPLPPSPSDLASPHSSPLWIPTILEKPGTAYSPLSREHSILPAAVEECQRVHSVVGQRWHCLPERSSLATALFSTVPRSPSDCVRTVTLGC